FSLPSSQLEAATEALEKIANQTIPFTIHVRKVSHFHPTSPTLYLSIDNDAPLKELHNKIQQPFEPQKLPYDYIPHITIGQQMDEEELHDVYSALRLKRFDLSTLI